MTIFDKFQPLAAARKELEQSCDSFFNIVMQEIVSGTEAVINGRPTILAGSNNYLGLSFDSGLYRCCLRCCPQRRHRHHRIQNGQRNIFRPCRPGA